MFDIILGDNTIQPSSNAGFAFDFTSDRFQGYMTLAGNYRPILYIPLIQSIHPGQGHFRALITRILELGYEVRIPCPMGAMPFILRHWRFTPMEEKANFSGLYRTVNTWVKSSALPPTRGYRNIRVLNESAGIALSDLSGDA